MKTSPSRRRRSMESDVDFSTAISASHCSHAHTDSLGDHAAHSIRGDALLLQRVTVADRHRSILHRLAIDRDAERRTDFVLPAVPSADRARLVIEDREAGAQLLCELLRELRHAVLLHEWKDSRFDGCQRGREAQHSASLLLSRHLLLAVRIHEQGEGRPIGADGCLHDIGYKASIVRLVEVLELLPRMLLMLGQVEVAAIVDALDLLEAEGATEIELNVEGRARVMRQLFRRVLMKLQALLGQAEAAVPRHALLFPVVEPLHVGARLDEELHLHLLEFTSSEDEVAGRDLVAERLSDLGNAEWHLLPHRLLDVQEVDVDTLRRFRTQKDLRRRVFYGSHEGAEHEIEETRLGERPLHAACGTLSIWRSGCAFDSRVVGAEALLAIAAIDERVRESGDVTARNPDLTMHQDRGVDPLDVLARAHHRVPPAVLEILLQLDAERAVIPDGSRAAVDLGGLEDESSPLAERHELLEDVGVGLCRHGGGAGCLVPGAGC